MINAKFYTMPRFNLASKALKAVASLSIFCALTLYSGAANAQNYDLPTMLKSGVKSYPDLLAQKARLSQSQQVYKRTLAQYGLQLNSSASTGASYSGLELANSTNRTDGLFGPTSVQVQLDLPLYTGGRKHWDKRREALNIDLASNSYDITEQNYLLDAATIYIEVVTQEERSEVLRQNLSRLITQKDEAQKRYEVGVSSLTDLAQVESRMAAAKIDLARSDRFLAESRARFVTYFNAVPFNLTYPEGLPLPISIDEAITQAYINNPELQGLKMLLNQGDADIEIAKSDFKPRVSLTGSIQRTLEPALATSISDNAGLFITLQMPLYTSGLNKSNLSRAKFRKDEIRYDNMAMERTIRENITIIWHRILEAESTLNAHEKRIASSKTALKGEEINQKVGNRTLLDVLNAKQELLNSELDLLFAKRDLTIENYRLMRVTGGIKQQLLSGVDQ